MKVTGRARYTAEFDFDNLAYGIVIQSTIAKGRITKVDSKEAEKAPGVLGVITHENAPKLNVPKSDYFSESLTLETIQNISLAASKDGELSAIRHDTKRLLAKINE